MRISQTQRNAGQFRIWGTLLRGIAMRKGQYSRRRFIGGAGASLGAFAGMRPGAALAVLAEGRDADLVVLNAVVYTVDPAMPKVAAFAVRGGRFIALGSDAEIRST